MAIKLILDTDIGSDIDDAWALALCLASPEIDLLGVTLVHADLDTRAKITLKMLKLAGRQDITVYKGLSQPITPGAGLYWPGHEGTETDFSDIAGLDARDGAVDFIIELVERSPGEIVICPIGPLTNIAECIRRAPGTMRKAKHLAIMGTTYTGDGPEAASHEHNAVVDPVATKLVLESGIPATVVGLNVTRQVRITRANVDALPDNGFGGYLAAMTRQYLHVIGKDSTCMHDPLAIAAVMQPDMVATRPMRADVLGDGGVAYTSDDRATLDVCTAVNAPAFETFLTSRVESLAGMVSKG